jgi:chromosome partitioning protein
LQEQILDTEQKTETLTTDDWKCRLQKTLRYAIIEEKQENPVLTKFIQRRTNLMSAKIIAVANQKGGVGKTTSTVTIGAALAQNNKKVLLIDSDPQGSLSVSLGIADVDGLSDTLADVMTREMRHEPYDIARSIRHHAEGIDYIPANIELSSVDIAMINTMSREYILSGVLSQAKDNYDFILIDCMPSLGMLTVNALAAADSVLIPVESKFLPIKGLQQLFQTISNIRYRINPALEIEGILFTMCNSTNLSEQIAASVTEAYGSQIRIFKTRIPVGTKAAEAPASGQTLLKYAPKSKVAEAYLALTNELLTEGKNHEQKA